MKFKMRLIISYTILAIIASAILGSTNNKYVEQSYLETVYNNAETVSMQLKNNFKSSIDKMEQAVLFTLSDQNTLQAIRSLSTNMKYPEEMETDITNEKAIVRSTVYTAYNLDNFYRVLVFNQYGLIATSGNTQDKLLKSDKKGNEIPWIKKVKNTKGNLIYISPHIDDWGMAGNNVFSVVKEIQGKELGYIEIQQSTDYLSELLENHDRNMKVILLKTDNTVMYSSIGINPENYTQYYDQESGVSKTQNSQTGVTELISIQRDEELGIQLLLIEDWKAVQKSFPDNNALTIKITLTFLIFSLLFIIVMADYLTKPLVKLRGKMENTKWSNISEDIDIKSADNDIQALTKAYKDLLHRLSTSIEKEKRLSILQLQAQFDTLQAQVNPHFLYNVLNVISNRGMQNDDETICEICGSLAFMLRYSTNIKERYATLENEIVYLEKYIYLLKSRFQDRLNITVNISADLYSEIAPKIILQQLVENAVEHGYQNKSSDMIIKVSGHKTENGWMIEVLDNGQGISKEQQQNLDTKMKEIQEKFQTANENLELEIGGLGLANTYGRMYLLYQNDAILKITNRTDGTGTIAQIGVKNVYRNDSR